ncbi:MAG: GntR family transcriptional regulator [Anaerolineae bacterium]
MEQSPFQPVDQESLPNQVVSSIRHAIQIGVLKPGDRLVEMEIAEQMAISRAPVREALRILERDGLVVTIPRKGTFVNELSIEDIKEIYSLRSVLEGYAIKLAIENAGPDDIRRLNDLFTQMINAAQKGETEELVERDIEFHRLICELSAHKRLLEDWARMNAQLRLFLTIKDRMYDDPREIAETHRPVLEAMRKGDLDQAEKVIKEHITQAGELVVARMIQEEEEPAVS